MATQNTERRVVTNRVFLLGLDELYRAAMKKHERTELLQSAKEVSSALSLPPANVPIEGYYGEDAQLTEYFRIVRALQQVRKERESEVAKLQSFKRLKQITSSPIFGPTSETPYLFSAGKDPLTVALENTLPDDWSLENLTQLAFDRALESDDFSLVGLAALAKDALVLTALRESAVLYAMAAAGCGVPREPEYVWQVDDVITKRATRFVKTLNELLGENLPQPGLKSAQIYWNASDESKVGGRCVRIGFDDRTDPVRQYHWAIDWDAYCRPIVTEFWDTKIWTTDEFRAKLVERMNRR